MLTAFQHRRITRDVRILRIVPIIDVQGKIKNTGECRSVLTMSPYELTKLESRSCNTALEKQTVNMPISLVGVVGAQYQRRCQVPGTQVALHVVA